MARHALVLTAGLGTRLRPLTLARAKPAIPVAGTPMIRRIIRWLAASGVTELVLNLHHLPCTLTAVVGDGSRDGARVRYSWEPIVLGSAGGPRHALPLIDGRSMFIVNGDTLTNVDLDAMAAAHERSGARVTLALVPNTEPLRYGGVVLDVEHAVTGFVRRGPSAQGSQHFIGIQIAELDVFAGLADGVPASSVGGVYDALIRAQPGSVRGFVSNARFWDVGTAADYLRTNEEFGAGDSHASHCGRGSIVEPGARVTRSILWDDVHIGAGSELSECIVGDGVHIDDGQRYSRVAIVRDPAGPGLIVASI